MGRGAIWRGAIGRGVIGWKLENFDFWFKQNSSKIFIRNYLAWFINVYIYNILTLTNI